MRTMILGSVMFVAVASAHAADSPAPQFVQSSTNVFRRFSVDLEKMKEFYGGVLGLAPLAAINMPGGGQMTRFRVGTSEIKLQPSAGESQVAHPEIKDGVGLRVFTFFFPDEATLTARFEAHGLPAPAFRKASSASSIAMVRDPSGQWVELVVVPGAPAAAFEKLEVGLTVTDVAKSRVFYRDFVGLDELTPVADATLGVTKYRFRLGTTTINVWSLGQSDRPAPGGVPVIKSSAGIQYVIGNVDAVDARAKERAVQIDRPLGPFGAGLRTIWLADPDGITNYFAQVAGRTAATAR